MLCERGRELLVSTNLFIAQMNPVQQIVGISSRINIWNH